MASRYTEDEEGYVDVHGESGSPSMRESEVIDVDSDAPAMFHSNFTSPHTSDSTDAISEEDDNLDESTNDENDYDEASSTTSGGSEHRYAYAHGRQALPMDSPGEENALEGLDMHRVNQERTKSKKYPRLPRMRKNKSAGLFTDNSPATTRHQNRVMRGITFRRRPSGKEDPDGFFWVTIFITSILSLAVLSLLAVYLIQTDFFSAHQSDLFGRTVDNRFTVVSRQDAFARIYFKSGYSNSKYSEAMLSFGGGELQLGRNSYTTTEDLDFYGMSIFENGSAAFTGKVIVPTMAVDYIEAGEGLVFSDGTMMTTAANMSGGVKEEGDLNLVSASGSIVASAGGNALFMVNPDGDVSVVGVNADDLEGEGIVFNGEKGSVDIRDGLSLRHSHNMSVISSTYPLSINSSRVVFGGSAADKSVVLTCDSFMDMPDESEEVERDIASARPKHDDAIALQIVGQSSEGLREGGKVRISGGEGLEDGGDVIIVAGKTRVEDDRKSHAAVRINSDLKDSEQSETLIGTSDRGHNVTLRGMVSINDNVGDDTELYVAGAAMNVSSQAFAVLNTKLNDSMVWIESNDISIGRISPSVHIGGGKQTSLTLRGKDTVLDATEALDIGSDASEISIGDSDTDGQTLDIGSSKIRLNAGDIDFNADEPDATTTFYGKTVLASEKGDKRRAFMEAEDGNVRFAADMTLGDEDQGSNITVRGAKMRVSSDLILIGGDTSNVALSGDDVHIEGETQLTVGKSSASIDIGSDDTSDMNIGSKKMSLKSSKLSINGDSMTVSSSKVSIGGNATSELRVGSDVSRTVIQGTKVSIGHDAAEVSVGSDSEKLVLGSDRTNIELNGHVTINGEELSRRRRLEDLTRSAVGSLDVTGFSERVPSGQHDLSNLFTSGFTSASSVLEVDGVSGSIKVAATRGDRSPVDVYVSLSGVRYQVHRGVTGSARLQCHVYKSSDNAKESIIADATTDVEFCQVEGCKDGMFLGVSQSRVAQLEEGDEVFVKCTVRTTVEGTILIDSAQLAVKYL